MKRTQDICRLISIGCWLAFAWGIAAELDVLPHLIDSVLLRWQVTLVAAVFLLVVADRLADMRCRCCGSDAVLVRGLFSASHELLCRRCLSWRPVPADGSVPTLSPQRLARRPGSWRQFALLPSVLFESRAPIQLRIRWTGHKSSS